MNILITSAGRRVSLVKAFKKELTEFYLLGKVFASDSNPMLSGACHVADGYFKVPRLNDVSYFDKLVTICRDNNIKLIIPTIDTELFQLAENLENLQENGIEVVISNKEFISKCRNKIDTHNFFRDKGLEVAKEYSKDNYKLPIFIKPYDGSRSVDNFIVENKEDLTDYHFKNDNLMFLEYLNHNEYDEYTCDLYYSKSNNLKCIIPRKRLEVRDGEVYKALTKNNILISHIQNHLSIIDGARGCITAQFFLNKTDSSKIIAIEINPRFGGGYPLSYLAGGNFPKWIIEEYFFNKKIDNQFNCWEKDLLMIRYDDEILVHGYKD